MWSAAETKVAWDRPLLPGGGLELGEGRDEDDRPIPPSGEQHAVGVDAQLESVAHVRGARVALLTTRLQYCRLMLSAAASVAMKMAA
jgi:hypothetical protein